MGIGNDDPRAGRREALLKLITPHGDWKQSFSFAVQVFLFISLPLMGIGNIDQPVPMAVLHPLITPHGDWKHGSNESTIAVTFSSLPLMGIGNGQRRPGDRRIAGLITPHGDWKPGAGGGAWSSFSSSLPLMGIGNLGGLGGFGQALAPSLITPHGDWKPFHAFRPAGKRNPLLITPHGDWKRLHPAVARTPAVVLITPHGDWKLTAFPPTPSTSTRTHYPSWGLETR